MHPGQGQATARRRPLMFQGAGGGIPPIDKDPVENEQLGIYSLGHLQVILSGEGPCSEYDLVIGHHNGDVSDPIKIK